MKVLIVNPIWTLENILPTNLAELAGYIRAHGYKDISIIDLNYELRNGFNADYMIERALGIVRAQKPDVIGITCNTIHVPFCVEFCREYKKRFKTPVILGGIHATFRPERMFRLTGADYVVRGEGEETFLELLETLEKGGKVDGIRGLSFHNGNKIIHNFDRPLIKDLAVLPFPAYDLLLPYIQGVIQGQLGANKGFDRIPILASRGCPFGCVFCSSNKMWRYQRRKPVARVIEEIRYLTEKCRERKIYIDDDCLNLNKEWFDDLLYEIKKLNIKWSCLARINMTDSNLLKRMKDAGCRLIYHGIESGNSKIRTMLRKGFPYAISNDTILNLVRQEIKLGISSICSFMTGIPTETRNEMEETANLCMELKKIGAITQFWIMTPYPDIKAVQMYKKRLVRVDRWKTLRQSDVNRYEQLFLYRKFYYRYAEENPDFYMFKPDMKLSEFFEWYRKSREKIADFDIKEEALDGYIMETRKGRHFVTANEKIQVKSIGNKKVLSHMYISIEYPFRNVDKVVRRLNKISPKKILLSIKSNDIGWSMEARRRLFRLITIFTDKGTQLFLMRPLPLEFFNRSQRNLIKKLNMPRDCEDCIELFKINKKGNIELCTGTELFRKEVVASRKDIYNLFINMWLWKEEKNAAGCMFSSRRRILQMLKRIQKIRYYLDKGYECFFNRFYDNAIKFLIKARKHGCDAWKLYFCLGLCYKRKKQFDMALGELREAEKRNPRKSDIHVAIAQCYRRKKDIDNMFLEIEKGLRLGRYPSQFIKYS